MGAVLLTGGSAFGLAAADGQTCHECDADPALLALAQTNALTLPRLRIVSEGGAAKLVY